MTQTEKWLTFFNVLIAGINLIVFNIAILLLFQLMKQTITVATYHQFQKLKNQLSFQLR